MSDQPPPSDPSPPTEPPSPPTSELAITPAEVEILEGALDPDTERVAQAALVVLSRLESYQGPIPHPDHLEKYEQVLPGAAERIFAMAEKEQQYRHDIDNRAIDVEETLGARGQHYGLIVALSGLPSLPILPETLGRL